MSKKIKMASQNSKSISEVFQEFVMSQSAKGVSDATLETYHQHITCIAKHLDTQQSISDLTKTALDTMLVSMRDSGLSPNSISSYSRVFKTFLNWCKDEGYSSLSLPNIRDKETIKETYTDEELQLLLCKPAKSCNFCEYRNWTIINFLMNSGCRAATVRNIQNRDVDLSAKQVIFRHNKNGRIQTVPLCNLMVSILRDYMAVRGGNDGDQLFPDQYGNMLSENGLRLAIAKYNRSRGVQKTSIHMFRHTFARKYLVDCGGNAFTLQKLLGHSTLNMTKHYCAVFDSDIAKNYDCFSPLSQIQFNRKKISIAER